MAFCKHRVMDKCKKDNRPCIFSKECCEPEEKKQTNADRMRNMSDEELAGFLVKVNSTIKDCMVTDCKWEDYPTHDKGCKDCFLAWLQAEVKEGNSNENT